MPLIQITCIYLIVGALGIGTHTVVDGDLWWRFLCADIVMTCVTYAFSLLRKNSSVYDAYWSDPVLFCGRPRLCHGCQRLELDPVGLCDRRLDLVVADSRTIGPAVGGLAP